MTFKFHALLQQISQVNRKILAVAVTGILLIAAGIFFLLTRDTPQIKAAAGEIIQTAEEIRQFYRNRPGYWGLNTDIVIKEGIAPNSVLKKGRLVNALNKDILVGQGADGAMLMPGARSFDIIYKNLTAKECRELASFAFSEEQSLGLLAVSIVQKTETQTFTWGGENKLPAGKAAAEQACRNGGDVIWTFE